MRDFFPCQGLPQHGRICFQLIILAMSRYHAVFFTIAICLTLPALAAGDSVQKLQLSTGVYWSQGDYREGINRSMSAIPLSARIQADTWSVRLATTLLTSERLRAETNHKEQKERQSGVGDTWLSATHHLPPQQSNSLFIDLTGKIKLPPAKPGVYLY